MSQARSSFFETSATADARSLALGRIALALVLLLDLIGRAANLTTFYANDGLLPNHTVLWRPTSDFVFSPFFMASRPLEAALLFAVCAIAYLMLLLGYRTKLAQVASWLCVLGLHGRTLFVQNGGDVVLVLLAFWTMFLPTGDRYSVDALAARLQGRQQQADQRVCSLAVSALLFQLVAIYALNALHKNGVTWREGTVVHYVLHQDRIVTWFGLWLRQNLSLPLSQALTWSALAIEVLIPVLLLLPFAQRISRTMAVGLVFALHLGFGLVMNLGIFVPVMLAFAVHLLPSAVWERPRPRPNIVQVFLARHVSKFWKLAAFCQRHLPPSQGTVSSRWTAARERIVLAFMIMATGQLLSDNHAFRRWGTFRQPAFARAITEYLQLHQGWGMFAPEAPTEDFNVVVDAITIDGRHVDPFNFEASGTVVPSFTSPSALGQNWLICDYVVGIAHRPEYHQAFSEWVQRYAERTGNPSDRIAAFEAFVVTDDSPPPGQRQPGHVRKQSFMRWPEASAAGPTSTVDSEVARQL